MAKKEHKTDNAMEYFEQTSTGVIGIVFGIIFLIIAPIIIISNEATNIITDNFWHSTRNWIMRGTGFILLFFGMKFSFYLIRVFLSIFPYLKSSFTFVNTTIVFCMSLITLLILMSIPWLFYDPFVSIGLSFPMALIWIYMRKIKFRHKRKLEREFKNSGDTKLSEADRIIETTYTDIETSVNKNKARIKKAVNFIKK